MPSDIQITHFIFRYAPAPWHPYIKLMRLDRPIGVWLLLFPCWWSLTLAHHSFINMGIKGWLHVLLFALGAFLMRSAGCVVNDLWDRDLDKNVERTKTRPLPAGDITPRQAIIFLVALLSLSFLVLLAFQSKLGLILGVLSLSLVAAYPLMKRVTWWPQLFLGFTFNWGALMGFAVTKETVGVAALLLYAGGIFWTLAYDTIYAHQDKEDDATVGIKSTALLFGDKSKRYVTYCFIAALVLFTAAKLWAWPSFMTPLLLIPPAAHIFWQLRTWKTDDADSCLAVFKSNAVFGWLVLLMLSL